VLCVLGFAGWSRWWWVALRLEPHERKVATLLQHLNAIRNDEAAKRREQQVRA